MNAAATTTADSLLSDLVDVVFEAFTLSFWCMLVYPIITLGLAWGIKERMPGELDAGDKNMDTGSGGDEGKDENVGDEGWLKVERGEEVDSRQQDAGSKNTDVGSNVDERNASSLTMRVLEGE
jgi:hypothetical protein